MSDEPQRTEDRQTSEETVVNEAGAVTTVSGQPEAPHLPNPTPVAKEATSPTSPGTTPEPKSPGLGTAEPPV